MQECKVKFEEIRDVVEFFDKNCGNADIVFNIDPLGRLIAKGTTFSGDEVTILLFNTESAKFPELILKKRFTK